MKFDALRRSHPVAVAGLASVPPLLLSAIAAGYLLFLLGAVLRWGGTAASHQWASGAVTLSLSLFLAASVHTASGQRGQTRRAWALIAAGAGLILAGQVAWDAFLVIGSVPPSPSLSDVATLLAVPAFIAGFIALRQPNRLTSLLLALDMVGLACALGILFATILWGDFQSSPFGSAGRVTILLYPTLFGTLAGAAWFLPMREMWRPLSLRLIMAGLLMEIVPLLVASPTLLQQGFQDNLVLDLLWTITGLLVALGALSFGEAPSSRANEQMMGPTAWLTILAAAAAMLLGYWHFHSLSLTPEAVQGLGGLLTGMVIVLAIRLGLTLNHGQNLVREVQRTAEALQESEERFRVLFERLPDGVVLLDPHDRETACSVIACNPAAAAMNGYTPEELTGQSINLLTRDEGTYDDVLDYLEEVRQAGVIIGEDIHYRKDGSTFPMEFSTSIVTVNGRELLLGIDRDITDRKRTEEALEHRALHDPLTDLPNRTLLRDRLHQAILASQRDGSLVGLLFMDLDRFKEVNDSYGHHVGDVLLAQVALRLHRAVREPNTVARLGGDEFAVLLPATDRITTTMVIRSIVALFGEPFQVEGQTLEVGASIGCALFPEHGEDASVLMRRADTAMYAAKRTATVHALYAPEQDSNHQERLALMHDLRTAIEGNHLGLHFQPLLDTRTGHVGEVEALVRWEHPVHGHLSPDVFIPAAEHSGLIKPLTRWVLDEALRQCAEWEAEGLGVGVAVNLSARTLHDPDMAWDIAASLRKWDVNSNRLTVEITESAIILDPAGALRTLSELQALGVRVAIDDFGTGYSSLAHLKKLPVDRIKVDRSFVMDMASNQDSTSIVRSVLDLGHNLGLEVVAEGVEDQVTENMLRALDCDLVQGYHISRPVPAPTIAAWLRKERPWRGRLHLA